MSSTAARLGWAPVRVSIPRDRIGTGRGPHRVWVAAHGPTSDDLGQALEPVRWSCTDQDGDRWVFDPRPGGPSWRVTDAAGQSMTGPRTLEGAVACAERHGAVFPAHADDVVP